MPESQASDLLFRLPPIRAKDVILAALQGAFALDNLLGKDNPYRFVRGDPKQSRVWICDPEGRIQSERDGSRMMITVRRAEYAPNELGLLNYAGGNLSDKTNYSDLGVTTVYVQCEAGASIQSEVLAAISYNILKMFRRDLMQAYDILNMKLIGITSPDQSTEMPGLPWITTVSVRVEIQEYAFMTELANRLNELKITGILGPSLEAIQTGVSREPDQPILPAPVGFSPPQSSV
jgi:hypothetical protein